MKWRSALFALFLTAGLALAVTSLQAQQPIGSDEVRIRSWAYKPQPATLRVERNAVQVGVVVRDSKGQVVSGLTPDDFAVYDDGKKQAVSGFSVETRSLRTATGTTATAPVEAAQEPGQQAQQPGRPRYVALYFDDLHTKSGDMNHVRLAAENFVRQGLGTNDQVALFTASSKVTVDFTVDASKVLL
ncbi:MAG TPA: VWA domain-containing protein [Nitrososphaerales archaeon]|nr:VWA domain-containing protein [Nitrososphaerales archaeon]